MSLPILRNPLSTPAFELIMRAPRRTPSFLALFALFAPTALAQGVAILDQAPNEANITYSDADCDVCGGPPLGTGQQSIAENFVVSVAPGSSHFTLNELVVWGGHAETNPTPPDYFTINIYSDFGGLPDLMLHSETDVAHTAVPTGVVIYSTDIIEYTFALASPPQLTSGTYWLEIFNDTTGHPSTWGVESGTLDAIGGIDGFAFSTYAPGTTWYGDSYTAGSPSRNFAMRIIGTGAVGTGPIQAYCFGTSCPCGNNDTTAGCGNSTGGGGRLGFTGTGSVAADDLVMVGSNLLPGKWALLFAGDNAVNGGSGNFFGDGLRCAGGSIRRMGVRVPDANGGASWGSGLASNYGFVAGETKRFQIWYRDISGSPCGTDFNLSNGLEVIWQP